MKRLLTFLTLLTLFFGVGWAGSITFGDLGLDDATAYTDPFDGGDFTVTFGGGGNNGKYYDNGSAIRVYAGGTMTIAAKSGNISQITITYDGNNKPTSDNVVNVGTYNSSTGVWTGSASSVVFTRPSGSGHWRVQAISVTIGGSTPTTYSITGTGTQTGGSVTASATSNITEGTSITITATPSTGYELSNLTVDGNDVTSSVNSSYEYTFNMPAHDVAVSATFTEQSVTPTTDITFERITSTNDLEAGKRYILVCENVSKAHKGIGDDATAITVSNGSTTLSSSSDVNIFTLGVSNNSYYFEYIYNNSTYYLSHTNSSSTGDNSIQGKTSNTVLTQWSISFDGNNAVITQSSNDNTYRLRAFNDDFRIYKNNSNYTVQLYKEVEETPQSSDVYIVGQINGHDSDPWNTSEGVQLTYNSTNDNYAANIYCTGVNNGTHEGYSLFLFAKSLPYDWNTTSNLYGSGADGSYWGIGGTNESAFGDEIPLYEGSKNSYRLPAGLYTVTVDLDYTGHEYTTKSVKVTKRDVTMTISPNSATFDDTKTVTMASNLTDIGGKIYYTTNGNDPRDPNSGRIEYTGELTINATTNFKAVAFIGNLYSEVVEKTYTKTPAAPVITPNGGTIYAATQVTITAEEGATIYYTTDGSTPTSENGTLYEGPFTVSATTTVNARAYVGDTYSNVTTAEFTYSDVQPSTGDFVLVTSASQLVAGNEYIIMTTDPDGYKLAMGDIVSSKGSWTQEFDINGNVGAAGSTVSVYSESTSSSSLVNILELENTNGQLSLKQQSAGTYLNITSSSSTDISASSSKTYLTIAIDAENYWATIQGSSSRQILFSGQNDVFGNYSTSNANASNFSKVYLYTRESNSVQPPVFTPAGGVYDVPVDVTISCATTGASIYYTTDGTEPSATNGTLYDGEELLVSESATYKAVAVKNGNTSSVVTAEYTIAPHTAIETVTLDYSEPFTAGIGKFTVQNVSGFAPVWTLDGEFGIKGTSYSANTNPTNNAAESRFLSPIIDMTDAAQPELTFSHQINSYFTNVTNQCQLFIRETTDGTDGTWVQLPITFSDPAANGGWTNDVANIDLSEWAGKKVQISFLYTNPTEGSGAGTWEIQHFVVADNSEYKMVNNIAEFLALPENTKAKFRNPVTVLYDYAQYSSNSYHEYIWVKDESGYMQFYLIPTLNSGTSLDNKAAYYENGDIIPGGFVVTKNYYTNGKYIQAYSAEALEAGFEVATQKGLADPEYMDFDVLDDLDASNTEDVATWCNHYITLEKIKLTSSSKNFNFQDENGTTNSCVGYNKYNGDGSLLKDGRTSADVIMPTDLTKFYNVKGIIQLWKGGWEFMPIEFTEWKAEKVTLRKLCADGEVNGEYIISNNLLGVYASADGTKLWVKDDNGQSVCPVTPVAPYTDNFAIEFEDLLDGNNNVVIPANTRLEQQYYDQSNWCEIQLAEGEDNANDFVGKIIKGGSIDGTFTNKTNPTMTGVTLTNDDIYSGGSYEPNYYIPASFVGSQSCNTDMYGQDGHGDFFFMTPKPQEYATIVWAIWDGQKMNMPTMQDGNSHNLFGEFYIDLSMNQNHVTAIPVGAYSFHAIIRKVNTSGAPALKGQGGIQNDQSANYMVYPLDIDPDNNPSTGINTVDVTGKAVKSVKFYNVAGIESATPFQGINIVVTEYTDGTRTTTKMLCR